MPAPPPSTVFLGLASASTIISRRDFLRWRRRTERHRRFLWNAYLIGAGIGGAVGVIASLKTTSGSGKPMPVSGMIFMVVLLGFFFWGPLIWLACLMLYYSGASKYKETLAALKRCGRVCETCQAVAFFEGEKRVFPKDLLGRSQPLSPRMIELPGTDPTVFVCDSCYETLLKDGDDSGNKAEEQP